MAKKRMYPSDEEITEFAEKIFWQEHPISTNTYGDEHNRPKLYGFKLGAKWARMSIYGKKKVISIKNK